jgi:photosystem II stability/assembly factor-like uncharacterized protein
MRFVWSLCALAIASTSLTGRVEAQVGVPESAYQDLSWRCVGPLRGGWATAACGVVGQPFTFYFGAADGGVWKTTDAGRTWVPSFQQEGVASVGALAVAPSDANVLYVGTGQVTTRWDITCGKGVFRSADGGATWEFRGLPESEHIGRLWVDPRDANTVLAAALGHLHAPNPERGVFRSTDGGKSWNKVLFVDDDTGAVDLAGDPALPDVLFASTWQARRFPWQAYFTPIVGPGSAIHRSTDGGKTWKRLAGNGLPDGDIGRIGLAVAPNTRAQRIYATIGADEKSGLYRSDDGGGSWQLVNSDGALADDYFSSLAVDPRDPDKVYAMGRSMHLSSDGGKTFTLPRGAPGGDDYHELWIDPEHPERRITASDQGAVITLNDGASWSSWYNQPTGQFYHVAVDLRFPYWIYSGQQDSGTVAVASRSDYGQLTFRDWHPVGGDERDFDIPFPGHPEIVYGSGLGGKLSRWDERTGQVRVVSPWPESSYGKRPSEVRYCSTWLSPLAISPHPPHAIYMAAQVLFRSLDGGESWEVLTPDMTGAVEGAPGCEGVVSVERATACGYGVIFSIALSPLTPDVLWLGTDNGRVHLSRDGGASWKEVTPPELGDWSKVASIDASPTDAATAYAAVDRHRLDDFRPAIYVTHDFGQTWRLSNAGIPDDWYVNVVRQDPQRAGLLYAGTQHGAFVSFDDGARWQSLQLDLPNTGVNDLVVHESDLVIATEGRGLWVLDDVSPLRRLDAARAIAQPTLFPPARAWRLSPNQNRDTPLPLDEPRAENPPAGAVIDYVLPQPPRGALTLEFVNADGVVVRSFESGAAEPLPPAEQYFSEEWIQRPEPLSARAGHNRFVWNLRQPRPRAISYEYSIAAVPGADTPALPQGIFVLPGRYEVRLKVDGLTLTQPLQVDADPRVEIELAELREQAELYGAVTRSLERATDAHAEVEELGERLASLEKEVGSQAGTESLREAARSVRGEFERLRKSPESDVDSIGGALGSLATDLEAADAKGTVPQRQLGEECGARLEGALKRWEAFRSGPVKELERRVSEAGRSAGE